MSSKMSSIRCLYPCVLLFVVSSSNFAPVQINVKKAALDFLSGFVVDKLAKELPLREFEDIRGSREVENVGFTDYQLTNIKVSFFGPQLPISSSSSSSSSWSLNFEPDNTVMFRMTNMEFRGQLTWNISVNFGGFELVSCEEVSMHASGMNVSMTFKLITREGNIKLFVDDCSCKVDALKLENKGFKMLASLGVSVDDLLKEEFENIIVKYSKQYVGDKIVIVPNSFPLSEHLQLLMMMVKDPLVANGNLEVQSRLMLAIPGLEGLGLLPTTTEYERVPVLSSDRHMSVTLSETICTENMKYLYEKDLLKYEMKGNASKSNTFFHADCNAVFCLKSFFGRETKDLKDGFFEISVEATDLPSCSLKRKNTTFEGKFKFKVFFRSKQVKVETPSDVWQADMSKERNKEGRNEIKMFVNEKTELRELFTLDFKVSAKILITLKNESVRLRLGRFKANVDPNSIGMSSKRFETLLNGLAASLEEVNLNFDNLQPLSLEKLELVKGDQFFQLNADLRAIGNGPV